MPSPGQVTKESFRAELEQLVRNFAAHEDELTSPGYTETQARTQFITPFFRALGWDVENRAARPRREMEVWEEKGPGESRPESIERVSFAMVSAGDSAYPYKKCASSLQCWGNQV